MKTIKQIISDADPRLKGVLVIMIVYVMVMATTVTSGATQEIKGYKETIEIQYQDGGQETKDYLVRQDTTTSAADKGLRALAASDAVAGFNSTYRMIQLLSHSSISARSLNEPILSRTMHFR